MENVIVEIKLPGISTQSDFVLPAHIAVGNVLKELTELLSSSDLHAAIDGKHPMLCDLDRAQVLDETRSLAAQGIRDGSSLMLL